MPSKKKKQQEPPPPEEEEEEEVVLDDLEPSQWKREGHPWVDKKLNVACTWAIQPSRNLATHAKLTGTITGFAPTEDDRRLPALGRVAFENPIANNNRKGATTILAMDLTGTEINDLQRQTTTTEDNNNNALVVANPVPQLLPTIQERYQRRLEHHMMEHILPPLVALAALEEATVHLVRQRIAQEDAEMAARANSSNNHKQQRNVNPHPPLYYTKPPNTYLTQPQWSEETTASTTSANNNHNNHSSKDPMKEHLISTPAAWMARIKQGCQLAYNEYLIQQQQEQLQRQQFDDASAEAGRRSSSRIARITTEQQQDIDRNKRGGGNTNNNQQQGVEIYLKGHRIAKFLREQQDQKLWQNQRQRLETEEAEENGQEEKDDDDEEEIEDEDDVDLFNPYLYPTYGDVLKSVRKLRLDDIQNSIPYWCQEDTNRTPQKKRRKDDEDDMENVLEVNVLPLDTLTLGIPPADEEEEAKKEADDKMELEEDKPDIKAEQPATVKTEQENDKKPAASSSDGSANKPEEATSSKKPDEAASLSKAPDTAASSSEPAAKDGKDNDKDPPQKVTSSNKATEQVPAAAKSDTAAASNGDTAAAKEENTPEGTTKDDLATDDDGKDSKPPAKKKKNGGKEDGDAKDEEEDGDDDDEDEETDAPTENLIVQWQVPETIEKAPARKQIYKHLQTQDHYTFGRYTFLLRRKDEENERLRGGLEQQQGPNEEELQRQAEEQARRTAANRAFNNRKAWDKWRFEGIHGGHTVWPSWQDSVQKWQSERNAEQQQESSTNEQAVTTDQVDADHAKALELAKKEQDEEAAIAAAAGGGRRTRRKGASSGGTVFYGQSSQLTAKQLVELILRLCSEKSAPNILYLQSIVAEDGTQDPVRRLRAALGKLVWRRNQLARLSPSTEWTDKKLLDTVWEKPLLTMAPAEPTAAAAGTGDVAMQDAADDGEAKRRPTTEAEALVEYLRNLHNTELLLRKIVLEHLTEIPIPIVATAADEKKNSNEGYDSADFEDQSEIEWLTEGHELIGKHLFRPRQMDNTNDLSTCEWFTIRAYVPSVGDTSAQNVPGSAVTESPLVERRARFRAAPFLEADAGEVEFADEEYLVLTEAQAHAGIKAAGLEQVNIDREEEEEQVSIIDHPFAGSGLSARITLYPVRGKKSAEPMEYTVVGHDSILGAEGKETVHRILILPYATSSQPTPSALWASLDVSNDTEIRCHLETDPNKTYRVQQSDFHPDSQAFAACRDVVNFLEKHQKAGPFLEPVDPVALGIPDYTKVIANPMDISTLSSKLENGQYSNVPPKQSAGRSPVARMLNGTFRDDVELIFDNAMLFNPPKDFIHQDASTLKKAVCRKMDSMSQSFDAKFRRSSRNQEKQSIYMDEDSDVDMYEYESDNDDDDDYHGGGSRRKRKRSKGQARPKADDNSTRAMEHAVRLQKTLSDTLGLRGPFANFRVENDSSSFSFPANWSCRRRKPGVVNLEDDTEEEAVPEETSSAVASSEHEKELIQLAQLQRTLDETESTGVRRSTRANIQEDTSSSRKKKVKASDTEYFMLNQFEQNHINATDELKRMPAPCSRHDIEYICERLHDTYYAKLYMELGASLEQSTAADSGDGKAKSDKSDMPAFGSFADGSFPPFLGRMVPVSLAKHSKFAWEIRGSFQIVALRWIIRGLIASGHLGQLEPMEQESLSSGVIMTNHVYYTDNSLEPFAVLDSKELARRRRANNEEAESSEDEVELSAYEKLRAERVARNAERLKALGLA
ncbi:Bromodomain-containing protein 2 [Seminavis robusta]|uniref:Bromodomain-containing protein 2 n=1 Tax=Seminavis robusta TaxID=568900 RepID=A0A9N8EDI2_9STRA|nr:Bromodomain-containing protein 2 [Seminavis robusta]|eukprot:Sro837_g209120.1 Bromodomain-containing protein 2 (1753) ;mRNA; f:12583-17841